MINLLGSLVQPVTGLLDKFIEDKDQKNQLAHEISTMAARHAQELAKGQLEINKAEAQSRNVFIAGWRPFIGWTCGVAMAYNYVIHPILMFTLAQFNYLVAIPALDLSEMMPVLMGMLGLGGLRSFEKYKGISK
jgi:phenylpyruvate tautomerase PptA (4-oxalocrotonate tautomerase family)